MATSYPGGLDSFTNPTATDSLNSATVPHATQHANANDAIEAIQAELGTDPAGASLTVKARFEAIEANGWVTSTRILDGTIVDGDINASAAIAQSKIANLTTDLAGKAPATGIAPSAITGTAVVDSDARLTDARTPTAHAASHASAGSDPITIAQSQVTDLTTDLAAKASTEAFPYHAHVHAMIVPTASSLGASGAAIYAFGVFFNTALFTTAQNNYAEWTIEVAAGTYTLRTLYRTNANYGIASISIDGGAALGTTIDCYTAASVLNNITDITGIALTAGRHTIRYTGATKNASSSGHVLYLNGFTMTRTGA